MEYQQETMDASAAQLHELPWHRPVMQRLEISTETRFGGGSIDDGNGLGFIGDEIET
jgi:hypothetical protein